MNFDVQTITSKGDTPLTRADVERLLQEVGSSDKLKLSGRNMAGIDLAKLRLTGTDLSGANLSGAKLMEADLVGADLSKANLSEAYLSKADLSKADLSGANLNIADLSKANLSEAYLSKADLSKADLSKADFSGANLSGANLSGAKLIEANLRRANLIEVKLNKANLMEANLSGAIISEIEREQLSNRGVIGFDDLFVETASPASTLRIRIIEEPLTPYNLTTIISALTELSTKFWLIANGRLAELIEYVQTHDVRFVEEAGLVITKITYNSRLDITFSSPNFDPKNIADAVVTTIDGITQRKARLEKAELENQAKAQAIKLAEQTAEQEQQMAALEREKQALEIEKQRLALLQQQLDLQKQGIEYALEIAKKTVDLLHPNADDATKGMIMQALLPNILQLQNGKGLVLALPEPKNDG